MAMALKADVAMACKHAGQGKPVDLVHLSRQTMGDRELEREILSIFLSQSKTYFDQLDACSTDEERKMSAHKLKGAAKGIGAWELAEIAQAAEMPGFNDLATVKHRIDEVRAYIADLNGPK